ncbi:NUDIX domain-containing protein [Streptococcus cuniculi]|nr:NUDIX domain-containing protein [Streptococcus cuniculi]MBF0778308.1 NUDIX domain-containing protein [Streptococcus cuniculi]
MRYRVDFRTKKDHQIFGVRATALILKNQKLFLSYREDTKKYYTIGGAVKVGESTEDAVVREVKEELGIAVAVKQLAFIVENHFTAVDKEEVIDFHNIEFHYLVEPLEKVPSHMMEEGDSSPCYGVEVDNLVNIDVVPAFLKTHLLNWSGNVEQIRLKETRR